MTVCPHFVTSDQFLKNSVIVTVLWVPKAVSHLVSPCLQQEEVLSGIAGCQLLNTTHMSAT